MRERSTVQRSKLYCTGGADLKTLGNTGAKKRERDKKGQKRAKKGCAKEFTSLHS
jgi:hypothetical protein